MSLGASYCLLHLWQVNKVFLWERMRGREAYRFKKLSALTQYKCKKIHVQPYHTQTTKTRQRQTFNTSREKWHIIGRVIQMTAIFLQKLQRTEGRKQLFEKCYQFRIIYSVKTSFRSEGEIQTFSDDGIPKNWHCQQTCSVATTQGNTCVSLIGGWSSGYPSSRNVKFYIVKQFLHLSMIIFS